ncbi:MAG: hypothetical protein DMG65_24375 [Candidatus Angelobacter sp. Gp1-AA117]|nr:MAG: hypothetical protein DMG65_24375 [Candidatus Angelobacter sp. Gp1-AA117]
MGFLKSLLNMVGGEKCPVCGTPGAQKSGDQVRCLNPLCQNFIGASSQPPSAPPQPKQTQQSTQPQQPSGSFSHSFGKPVTGTIAIQYKNFQGQNKTFSADAGSLRRKGRHVVARVAPSGKPIALSVDRIQNMNEIDPLLPPWDRSRVPRPNKKERQVIGYHTKHGTTSPLFEKIKAKYSDK